MAMPATLAATGIAIGSGSFTPAHAVCMGLDTGMTGYISACGPFAGNDSATNVSTETMKTYTFSAKANAFNTTPDEGDSSAFEIEYDSSSKSGTWEVFDPPISGFFAIALKAGPQYAIYEFDGDVLSGNWDTSAFTNPGGNQPDISHISLYVTQDPTPPTDTPEPLTLLGAATAIGLGTSLKRQFNKKRS